MEKQAQAYYNYFNSPAAHVASGGIPVFRGARRAGQYGAGIGDFFRGIFRRFLPIAVKGAATFLSETVKNNREGASFKDAAKAALRPTLGATLANVGEEFMKKPTAPPAAADEPKPTQTGSGGGSTKRKRVFKGGQKRAGGMSKKLKYAF